jgi:hypothetical protein
MANLRVLGISGTAGQPGVRFPAMRRSPERSAADPQFERGALPQRGGGVARPAHPQTQQPSVWRWKRHCESYGGAVDGFRVPDEPGAVNRVLAIEIVPCHGARHADLPRDGRPDCVNEALPAWM